MIEFGWCSAHPAEFIATEHAKHVIATGLTLNFCPAHRTKANVQVIFNCPFTELAFHVVFAASKVAVPRLTALEANPVGAFAALQAPGRSRFSSHHAKTVMLGAEAHKKILLKDTFVGEPLQSLNKFVRIIGASVILAESDDLIDGEVNLAASLGTSKSLQITTIHYLVPDGVDETLSAERMATGRQHRLMNLTRVVFKTDHTITGKQEISMLFAGQFAQIA